MESNKSQKFHFRLSLYLNHEGWETLRIFLLWDNVHAPSQAGYEQLSEHPGLLPWPSWFTYRGTTCKPNIFWNILWMYMFGNLFPDDSCWHTIIFSQGLKLTLHPRPLGECEGIIWHGISETNTYWWGLFMLSVVFLTCSNPYTNKMILKFLFVCQNQGFVWLFK